uniref:Integrator complex subunit 14 n=1 Tax=Clastoptera arizonana TaxID=38151 RepID=A0A1B6BY33_9HEMI
MPTVILLDNSLSMAQPVLLPESGESTTHLQLAIHGINGLLDYLTHYCKLEFVSLLTFSSMYEVISPFTRDFDMLKARLQVLEEGDQTFFEPAFIEVNRLVLSEWGSTTPCQVILVTDGSFSNSSILENLSKPGSPIPFAFPGNLTIATIAQPGPENTILQNLIQLCGNEGSMLQVDSPLSQQSVHKLFLKLVDKNYASYSGFLKCGNLGSKIMMSPVPVVSG